MADNPPPKPKPEMKGLDDKTKDLEAEDRLANFEIQNLASSAGTPDDPSAVDGLTDKPPNLSIDGSSVGTIAMDDTPGTGGGGPGDVKPDKAPDGPQSPSPSPDPDTISGGGGSEPGPIVFTRTAGDDDDFRLGADIFDLDADPEEGGEVIADPDEGGEIAMEVGPDKPTGGGSGPGDKAPDGPQSPSPSPDPDTISGGGGGAPGPIVFTRTDGGDGFDPTSDLFEIDPEFDDRDHKGGELRSSDPEEGGEVAMPPRPVTMTADDLRSSDPEEGGEVVPDFGAGAMPPRPVTMTAEDLRSSDPEEGGEIVDDPDGGDEIFLPVAAVGGDDVFTIVAPTFDEVEPAAPEPELTDFEVAGDFDQASHTLAPEEG